MLGDLKKIEILEEFPKLAGAKNTTVCMLNWHDQKAGLSSRQILSV
jgi:hypothetical protein